MNDNVLALARKLTSSGDLRAAASAYDRAYGLDPRDQQVATERCDILDRLAVEEHGIRFRYIPAGTFLMGSEHGDPDERPVHRVSLGGYWLAEAAMSWATFCNLSGWQPPPRGVPEEPQQFERPQQQAGTGVAPTFFLHQHNKIRLQYCEDETLSATDWHAHLPEPKLQSLFGDPPRTDPQRPYRYDRKPMVSIGWQDAEALCTRLSTSDIQYCLPTEAEWERAARGGLVGRRYPWGDDPPTPQRCDFDRFSEFSIRPVRDLPPNSYGLYGMTGSVWEWTSDWYDSQFYANSPADNPTGPASGEERVLRGGSWADCADAVTVSFRMSRGPRSWTDKTRGAHFTANIGFRLCRHERIGIAD